MKSKSLMLKYGVGKFNKFNASRMPLCSWVNLNLKSSKRRSKFDEALVPLFSAKLQPWASIPRTSAHKSHSLVKVHCTHSDASLSWYMLREFAYPLKYRGRITFRVTPTRKLWSPTCKHDPTERKHIKGHCPAAPPAGTPGWGRGHVVVNLSGWHWLPRTETNIFLQLRAKSPVEVRSTDCGIDLRVRSNQNGSARSHCRKLFPSSFISLKFNLLFCFEKEGFTSALWHTDECLLSQVHRSPQHTCSADRSPLEPSRGSFQYTDGLFAFARGLNRVSQVNGANWSLFTITSANQEPKGVLRRCYGCLYLTKPHSSIVDHRTW